MPLFVLSNLAIRCQVFNLIIIKNYTFKSGYEVMKRMSEANINNKL